jgi:replicative DNA helicase
MYDRTNALLLQSLIKMRDGCVAIDAVGLLSQLRSDGNEHAGPRISEALNLPVETTGAFEIHIRECARRRRVIDLARVLAAEAHDRTADIDRLVSGACSDLEQTGADVAAARAPTLRGLLKGAHERLLVRSESGNVGSVPFSTGHWRLDRDTGGFRPGKVAIVAAQSHWGKSSYALMVADSALVSGRRVLIVSAEDDEETWGDRWLQYRAEVPRGRFESGIVHDGHHRKMVEVISIAPDEPMFLDAIGRSPEWTAREIRALIRREPGEWIVMCDYIGAWAEGAKDNAQQLMQINHIARTFTTCIKTLRVAGVLFSQITPAEKMGIYSLRGSKDISNAAEVILLGAMDDQGNRMLKLVKNKPGPGRAGSVYEMGSNQQTQSFRPEINLSDWEWGEIDGPVA